MSTVHIERNLHGQAIRCIDMVHSPDDDGWYFQEFDFPKCRTRTSRRIFKTAEIARRVYCDNKVTWGKWE